MVVAAAALGRVFRIVASTGGKCGPARRNGTEIVTDRTILLVRVTLV
jgi:hypothetical protein